MRNKRIYLVVLILVLGITLIGCDRDSNKADKVHEDTLSFEGTSRNPEVALIWIPTTGLYRIDFDDDLENIYDSVFENIEGDFYVTIDGNARSVKDFYYSVSNSIRLTLDIQEGDYTDGNEYTVKVVYSANPKNKLYWGSEDNPTVAESFTIEKRVKYNI